MRTVDRVAIHAPLDRVFAAASNVERWPEILSHYRWVRVLSSTPAFVPPLHKVERGTGGEDSSVEVERGTGGEDQSAKRGTGGEDQSAKRGLRDEDPAAKKGNTGVQLVEMAAWRPFGLFNYPTWWVSEMSVHPVARQVRYRHVRGITRGMDVVWQLTAADGATDVEIVHEWTGPRWPLIGRLAADLVIGPVFIHGIASRTLAGIKRYVEERR